MSDDEVRRRYEIQAQADVARTALAETRMPAHQRRAFQRRIDALTLKLNLEVTANRDPTKA